MKALPICHYDFENEKPIEVFHKELEKKDLAEKNEKFQNRHILFRRKAYLKKANKAILRITADDYYKLYINGSFITQGPAASYPNAYFYNEIDLTDQINADGEYTFAVHTYYQGLINRVWVSGDRRQMLYFSLEIDGEEALFSDESWRCADHTGYSQCGIIGYKTAFAEIYDSRSAEIGFECPDFDDSDWGYARLEKHSDHKLIKQTAS